MIFSYKFKYNKTVCIDYLKAEYKVEIPPLSVLNEDEEKPTFCSFFIKSSPSGKALTDAGK